ncbi:MAG: transcription-repair coupling factor [Actinobacteria bacterium]|nr:transcription-repair coupling factor [Actinomycetota bacterium]
MERLAAIPEMAKMGTLFDGQNIYAPSCAVALLVAGAVAHEAWETVLVVTPTTGEAEQIAHDCAIYAGEEMVRLFPPWDTLPFERVSPQVETMGKRLEVIWRLGGSPSGQDRIGLAAPASTPAPTPAPLRVLVAPVRAALQRLGPIKAAQPLQIKVGQCIDLESTASQLAAMGYRREYLVEHRGEFAIRGGILDIYPSVSPAPVRMDLFGDEVERIAYFDPGDQRSRNSVDNILVFAAREMPATDGVRERARELAEKSSFARSQFERISSGQLFDGMESWMPWLSIDEELVTDMCNANTLTVLVDPNRLVGKAIEVNDDEHAIAQALSSTWATGSKEHSYDGDSEGRDGDRETPKLHLPYERLLARSRAGVASIYTVSSGPTVTDTGARTVDVARSDPEALVAKLEGMVKSGFRVVIAAHGRGSAERMMERIVESGYGNVPLKIIDTPDSNIILPGIYLTVAPLEHGVVMAQQKLAIITEADLSGHRTAPRHSRMPAPRSRRSDDGTFFDELTPGGYVVHRDYGIARYEGLATRTVGGRSSDYLLLGYKGNDKLYVPVDQIGLLTPYSGGDSPTLSRLGGSDWERTRSRARAAVHEIAVDLVELYKERIQAEGYAFSPDTPWQREFEDSFPFTETPDQMRAIDEIKADMEQPRPMDRLVCGDVGFGKTEVALRAVFKAVQDGKQVAVLVPTTLLGQQHAQNFKERLASFPIRVDTLSRFSTSSEARHVLAGLASGSTDVVIGTHKLLQEGVKFKDLGLVVVDEEQRFGVTHKEALKRIAKGVDMITLTANPIPRTLEMALTGIRELSLINTPPVERRPILTYVGEYDESAVVEAIRRELLREGLVFYVHNHVHDINLIAERLRYLVPVARVAVAHGQMDESVLEKVMIDVWERKYDVLVATTIIESGIDVPEASTLVVDRADRLGLGQLHQLRGRVGRAGQRAYAYFLYPRQKALGETAYERLRTIGENTELGAGFKIAMRDLEIRGAGNLLGRDQSGHISAVGYDLYVQMVAEAVSEIKGEPGRVLPQVAIDLPIKASIPSSYIARDDIRLEAYRKLAGALTYEAIDEIQESWIDRFGPIPKSALVLLQVARLKVACIDRGISDVTVTHASPEQTRLMLASKPTGATAKRWAGNTLGRTMPSTDSGVPGRSDTTGGKGTGGRKTAGMGMGMSGRNAYVARISPVSLLASAEVRLARLYPEAIYKEGTHQIVTVISNQEELPNALRDMITDLLPEKQANGQ